MNFIDADVISFIIMWDTDYIKNASDIAENIIDYPKYMKMKQLQAYDYLKFMVKKVNESI